MPCVEKSPVSGLLPFMRSATCLCLAGPAQRLTPLPAFSARVKELEATSTKTSEVYHRTRLNKPMLNL